MADFRALQSELPPHVEVLTDSSTAEFAKYLLRWSDIDKKTPGAIVLPTSETEIVQTVRWALDNDVPFVTKAGGHSEWSTIGADGLIVDLSKFSGISIDTERQIASLRGSILSKDVSVALAEKGFCTALGNGNTVGAVGYFIGGGASITTPATGFGAEQIVSAHVIAANGDSLEVTEDTHPDLLWAIRGAGQYFALVTRLDIRLQPLSVLGEAEKLWAGSFVFPLDRAAEVSEAMHVVMNDSSYATSGLMMIMAPPPHRVPSLVIAARMTGQISEADNAFKLLHDLKPIVANGAAIPIETASDARAAIGAKGDFKRFGVVGLHGFDAKAFLSTIDIWKRLVTDCPDAINTAFNFQWDSRFAPASPVECAMSLRDVRFWQNNLIWHTDVKNREKVDDFNVQTINAMRSAPVNAEDFIDFVNGDRNGPIEHRFRGAARLARLKELKKLWDPKGVFTSELL